MLIDDRNLCAAVSEVDCPLNFAAGIGVDPISAGESANH
jgi:hypothetical protein